MDLLGFQGAFRTHSWVPPFRVYRARSSSRPNAHGHQTRLFRRACLDTSSVQPSAETIETMYTAARVTFGGAIRLENFTLPADFRMMDPRVTSPLAISTVPRLTISSSNVPDGSTEAYAQIYVRGWVKCSFPTVWAPASASKTMAEGDDQ